MGRLGTAVCAVGAAVGATLSGMPAAQADQIWIAVANSPNREQLEWVRGRDRAAVVLVVLEQCARLEQADDCRLLAVSTDCIATAWDVAEPLNHVWAVPGFSPEVVRQAVMAAAGPHANDVIVECTWSGNSVVV